jgi:single-strand DNA-binding protein
LNYLIINGNIVRDVQVFYTKTGKAFCHFDIAHNHNEKEVTFLNCVAWEKVAENVAKYCKKGTRVNIAAFVKQERWIDKDQVSHSRIVANCYRVEFISGNNKEGKQDGKQSNDNKTENNSESIPY